MLSRRKGGVVERQRGLMRVYWRGRMIGGMMWRG